MPTEAWECPSCTFNNTDNNAQEECGMCASTRSRPNKRAAVVFASGAKKAPVAAQPPAPADKKEPAAVRRPIAGPTGVPGPTVPASIRPTGVPDRTVPAIRPMATVLEIVGTSKADRGRRCEEHSCYGKEVLVEVASSREEAGNSFCYRTF